MFSNVLNITTWYSTSIHMRGCVHLFTEKNKQKSLVTRVLGHLILTSMYSVQVRERGCPEMMNLMKSKDNLPEK